MQNTPVADKPKNTTAKTVTPLFRCLIKVTKQVIYRVRNGQDKEYLVTISSNGNTGCTQCSDNEPCPSTKSGRKCYHIKACLKLEDNRVEASYNGYRAEGVNAEHASEKVQRYSKAAELGMSVVEYLHSLRTPEEIVPSVSEVSAKDVPQLSSECPQSVDAGFAFETAEEADQRVWLESLVTEVEEEEFIEGEVAERWTQEALDRQMFVAAFDPCYCA